MSSQRALPESNLLIQLAHRHPEFLRLRQELEESANLDPSPRIAVCGLMNAGKSALLNGLTGNLEIEVFETKAVRATIRVQELEHEGRIYLDTPGIDACDEDDQQAWSGLANSDVIIFVHSLRTGTLDEIETTFLRELQRRYPKVEQNMLVVLTHAESAPQEQKRERAIREILQSVFEIVPPTFLTSFSILRNGMRKRNSKLLELCGYSLLDDYLNSHVILLIQSLSDQRADRDAHRYAELERLVDRQIAEQSARLLNIEKAQASRYEQLHKSVQNLFTSISEGLAFHGADSKHSGRT